MTKPSQRLIYEPIHVRQSTFRGGLDSPVHRWFRLTPSFGPELVDRMLSEMRTEPQHMVLDPFSGAGTTLIQCKFNGLRSCGFEINPFLHFVCGTCANPPADTARLTRAFTRIERQYRDTSAQAAPLPVEAIGIALPAIHNVFRWWRGDVLKELLLLREAIAQAALPDERGFFELALAGVLIPDLTNVTLGRLQLHFVDKSSVPMDVWGSFQRHALQMIEDAGRIGETAARTPCSVFLTDSTTLEGVSLPTKIDRVITSPPYPNRYSYVWNTRPYLYFFRLMDSSRAAAALDRQTIGGTWGSATSVLAKGRVEAEHPAVERIVAPVAEQVRAEDPLMANYIMKYFNLLARQILRQNPLLSDTAKLAYVVGCSRIKGVYIETDRLLGELFEQLDIGCRVRRIERFRYRNSGKNLYESIVYAEKG